MSKYFGWVNGKPHDFIFKKHPQGKGWYTFYLGEYKICTVVANPTRNGKGIRDWSCIASDVEDTNLIPVLVDGFKTRYDAVSYGLKVNKLTSSSYNK